MPLTISSKDGLVDQVSFFNKTVASKDMSGYYLIRNGEFAYNKSYSVGYDFGSIKRLDRYPMGVLSTLYICFALNKHNTNFVKTYFDSLKWYKEIYLISAEGARNHGLLNIPTEDFFNSMHYIPSEISEQEKIADFMSLIDQKIQKQEQLVELLKKYKKGLVSEIMNQKININYHNEILNTKWKSYMLNDVVEFLDGKRKPLESIERSNMKGQYPYYGASGIIDYINDYLFDEELLLLGEDGANILTRSTPLCFIAKGKYWVNNHAHVMRPKKNFDIYFLCEALENIDYTRYNTGTAQPKLNQEKCRSIVIKCPNYDVQEKIGSSLSIFNRLITLSEEKLDKLLALKRGLLQQLFI